MSALLTIIVALVVSIAAIIVLTRYLNLHAFFSLLIAAVICGLITNIPVKEIIALMQEGFGLLLRQIGFLVALGSCLGMMLEKTGGMEVISKKVVGWFGAKRSTLALSFTGIVVGIPVFCDSGFIILSRLIPSIPAQTSILPAELSLALSTGLYTTHTLVPPTPGPLAAAVNLGLEDRISIVMLIGIVASLPVGLVAYFFSKRLAKGMITSQGPIITERSNVNAWLAFAPLILPLVLIALSVNPIVALAVGVGLSFLLIKKKSECVVERSAERCGHHTFDNGRRRIVRGCDKGERDRQRVERVCVRVVVARDNIFSDRVCDCGSVEDRTGIYDDFDDHYERVAGPIAWSRRFRYDNGTGGAADRYCRWGDDCLARE